MNINIIAIGKLKEDYFRHISAEYEKRLSAFCKVNIIELNHQKLNGDLSKKQIEAVLEKEADLILSKTSPSFKVALCFEGERFTSERFAEKIEKITPTGRDITFIIGSPYGLAEKIKKTADLRLSLSDMTFPHRLARIMLLEQLYRAFTIINNIKYHKI